MNIIFDTDLTNEVDDCFALVYILKSELLTNLSAITLEPYDTFWQDYDNKTTMIRNHLEANKILKILNYKNDNLIYNGSKYFLHENKQEEYIEAVDKIINITKKNKTIILATGCLTNIALALLKDPSIAKNIKIIWLGGRATFASNEKIEFNLRQDIKAAQIVFGYIKDITMIYSKEIASNMKIPLEIIIEELSNKNDICTYLLNKYLSLDCVKEKGIKTLYDITVPILLTHPEFYNLQNVSINSITDKGEYITNANCSTQIKYCENINSNEVIKELLKTLQKNNLDNQISVDISTNN